MRNVIKWNESPIEADGWGRTGMGAFWWRRPYDGEVVPVRLGEAKNYVPDDPQNIHVGRGHQAPVTWIVKWWVLRHMKWARDKLAGL